MDKTLKLLIPFITLLNYSNSDAVNISLDGQGEALILPYYSVNNDLNTIYQINNTTTDPKAIRITFHEGEGGLEVFSFNVYLAANDSWSAALAPGISTIGSHLGEPTAIHFFSDTSCAPFLDGTAREFLPYVIDSDIDFSNRSMRRSTDGFIEIIEMGVVTDNDFNSATALTHNNTGVPNDCQQLQDAWLNGYWILNSEYDIDTPTGGLTASAAIVDINNGFSYSFDAVAFENFWELDGIHATPGDLYPNISYSHNESQIMINGEIQTSTWSSGFEAVTALLMQSNIFNEFDFDSNVLGNTEWVITFPTKHYHVNNLPITPPFSNYWDGANACDTFDLYLRDRNNRLFDITSNPAPPQGQSQPICKQVSVIEFLSDANQFNSESQVLGSDNLISIAPENNNLAESNGWGLIDFNLNNQSMTPGSGPGYRGLPAIGFKIQRVTNNNAQPGLIANYGHVAEHKGQTLNTTQGNTND